VGGNYLQYDWTSAGRYRYTSQRRGDTHVTKVGKNLVTAHDSVSILKFHRTLELVGTSVAEPDKDQFVRSVEQGVREHGQQSLYAILRGTIVMDFLANHHLFSLNDVLTSIEVRETVTDASAYNVYEQDNNIRICYDHYNNFYDLPVPAILSMAMDICNASQSFDIEGAQ
jgi:hypothetical protein